MSRKQRHAQFLRHLKDTKKQMQPWTGRTELGLWGLSKQGLHSGSSLGFSKKMSDKQEWGPVRQQATRDGVIGKLYLMLPKFIPQAQSVEAADCFQTLPRGS